MYGLKSTEKPADDHKGSERLKQVEMDSDNVCWNILN